jgi:hypothetical protein
MSLFVDTSVCCLKSIDYACVFGSFARGTTHKDSDVDVLVLECSEDERFQIISALSDRSGREANPQFYSVEEFRGLAASGETIALSILGNPRISLKGEFTWP